MAIITQTVHLTTKTNAVPQIVRAVQNDSGRDIKMILDDLIVTSGMTGELTFKRSDGTFYGVTATPNTSDSSFTAQMDQALTQPGKTYCQLKVTDTDVVSTFSFVIYVEADQSGTVTPQEGIDLVSAVQAAEDAADRAESAASTFETDTTLSVPGMAADAKATGDAISAIEGDLIEIDATLTESGKAADAKAVGDRIGELRDTLTEEYETKTYTDVEATSSHTGNRVYYNSQYNLIAQDSNGSTKKYNVYAVTPGKYKIKGYGDNSAAGVMAVVGNADIATSGAVNCGLLEVVTIPGDDVSYGVHTIEVEITSSGYLYVNCGTTIDAYVQSLTTRETLAPITDKTLLDQFLPSNSLVVGNLINKRGVYISSGSYYHFVKNGNSNIIRLFTRRGPNNLFQWNQIILGDVTDEGIDADTSYIGFGTDIIGPISIWNGTLFPGKYGAWSGGNHGKTIDNVEYATAEQIDFKCLVNGVEVNADGLYYGDVQFVVTNKLYFPQSITGADLTSATLAIIEHRTYDLVGTEMRVRVWLECKEDIRVALYYGMQMADFVFDSVFCLNNGFVKELANIASAENLAEKERRIILTKSTNGLTLSMYMSDIGIGNYNLNDGSEGYVTFPIHGSGGTKKTYYKLIYKSPTQPTITSGTNLVWEGVYDLHFE